MDTSGRSPSVCDIGYLKQAIKLYYFTIYLWIIITMLQASTRSLVYHSVNDMLVSD